MEYGDQTTQIIAAVLPTAKVGTFSRADLSVTGTQDITTVGFRPSSIIISATRNSDWKTASLGFSDNVTEAGLYNASNTGLGAGAWPPHSFIIFLDLDGSNDARATISAWLDNGFTLTWTKGGSPTGAASCQYMAFK